MLCSVVLKGQARKEAYCLATEDGGDKDLVVDVRKKLGEVVKSTRGKEEDKGSSN